MANPWDDVKQVGEDAFGIATGPVGDLFNVGKATADAATESARAFRALGTFFLYLLEPSTWVRFALGLTGLTCIGVGSYLFVAK